MKRSPAQRAKTVRAKGVRRAKTVRAKTVRAKTATKTPLRRAARRSVARKAASSARRKASHISTAHPRSKSMHAASATPPKSAARPPVSGNGSIRTAAPGVPGGGYRLPSFLSVSPNILQHPWEHRRDYLILVAAIAASDSELHPDELRLLTTWMDRFNLTGEARGEVLRVANRGEIDLVQIARQLASSPLTWSVMLDMMGMAMADGVLMDDEILLLRGLAAELKIDPIDFNILIEFVHSAHQAAQLSNPEPLYEHAIESAFELLRKRQVKLFDHTRLCVNYPEYDRQLKERWVRFEAAGHA